MLIGIHDQHRLSIGGFDQILQRIQLSIMDDADVVELIVHRAIGQLQELPGQRRCVDGQHIAIRIRQEHVPLHLPVQLLLPGRERQLHHIVNSLRHLQVIRRPHGHTDVPKPPVDFFLRAGLQLMLIGQPAVGRIKEHVEVALHRSAQPDTAIQQEHLRPQILQPIGCRRSGQAYHAGELREYLLERQKPFGPAVLERGKLVDHQHVEGQSPTGKVLDEPFHVFPVDDIQLSLSGKSGNALPGRADHALHAQSLQVLPF